MNHSLIGQLLATSVPFSEHDVEEILEEQNITRRPFGEIAVSWGLCTPAHVWNAWARQPHQTLLQVDLIKLGIDAQAAELFTQQSARRFNAVPIRAFDRLIVVAITDPAHCQSIQTLLGSAKQNIAFVLANPDQITQAIATYYAPA